MEVMLIWLFFALLVGMFASKRGRSGAGWMVLAAIISPLLAWLLLLVLADLKAQPPAQANGETVSPETHVRCPDCRELVRFDARKCRHCGAALQPQQAPVQRTAGYNVGAGLARLVKGHREPDAEATQQRSTGSDRLPPA